MRAIAGFMFVMVASLSAAAQTPQPDWVQPLADKLRTEASISVLIQLRAPTPSPVPLERERASAQRPDSVAATARSIAAAVAQPLARDLAAQGILVREVYTYQPIVLADVRRGDLVGLAMRDDIAAVYENAYIPLGAPPPTARPIFEENTTPSPLDREGPQLDRTVRAVNAEAAWARGYTGQGTAVAVMDTGINVTHDMFRGRIVAEACFSDGSISTNYESLCPEGKKSAVGGGTASLCPGAQAGDTGVCVHGSHVAGIAMGDNYSSAQRLRGVAPEARLIAVQVFSRTKGCPTCLGAYTSDLLAAMDWLIRVATTYNLAAINMSLGGTSVYSGNYCPSMPMEASIKTLRAMNVLTVISAGNGGYTGALSHPGCIRDAITVGSISLVATPSYFSNAAPDLDLFAPGESVKSATYGTPTSYATYSGTSMAAPHAAGAVAILKSKLPTATAAQLEHALKSSGPKVKNERWTWTTPRLDIDAALDVVGQDPPPPGVTMAGLFPGDRPDARSVIRLINPGNTGFSVPITVVQETPRLVLGVYKSALIQGYTSVQFSVRDMETALRAQSQPTSMVSAIINPPMPIYAQHVVVDNAGQTLSNVTMCTTEKRDPGTVLNHVHTQAIPSQPSYVTLTNTGPLPKAATFYLYNSVTGESLGSANTPVITASGSMRFAAQSLFETSRYFGPSAPSPSRNVSYVTMALQSGFTGALNHSIELPHARVLMDMTPKCAI